MCCCCYQEVYYSSSESATREEEAPGTAVTATPTSTRISHPHGEWSEWRCWYARRLQPVHFPIERPQKRTGGGSIQDQIAGSVPSHVRPGGVVGYAPNRRGRTPARDSSLRCHRISYPKNRKHARNGQLESNLSNLARINHPLTQARARMRRPLQPTRPRIQFH